MELIKYLPSFYYSSLEVVNIQDSINAENNKLQLAVKDLIDQLFVVSATWGLDYWENYLGIESDISESYSNRREVIKAKLRGIGTTTIEMIKNTAAAFTGGEVEVIEYPLEYRFVIQFIGILGIPPNMSGLINAIEEIKPAHLAYSFKYTYTVWNNLKDLYWNDVQNKTWSELRVYKGE